MAGVDWASLMDEAEEIGGAFDALPAGEYDVIVDSAEDKEAASGNPMIKMSLKVESGPLAGRIIFNNFVHVLEENAKGNTPEEKAKKWRQNLGFWFKNFKALGVGTEIFKQEPSYPQLAAAIVGQRCRVKITDNRLYNGEKQNDVKSILPPAGGQVEVTKLPDTGMPQGVAAAAPSDPSKIAF